MLLFGAFVGGYMATFSMATQRLDGDRSISYNAILLPFAISNAVMGVIYFLSILLRRRCVQARRVPWRATLKCAALSSHIHPQHRRCAAALAAAALRLGGRGQRRGVGR